MIKSDNYIRAIKVRDKYRNALMTILNSQLELKPDKRTFPIYYDNWKDRLLKLEYLVIDYKYGVIK